jgi:hypothetical protein
MMLYASAVLHCESLRKIQSELENSSVLGGMLLSDKFLILLGEEHPGRNV